MERSALESNLLKDFVDPHLTIVAGREFQGLTTRQEKKLCLIDECASGTSSRSSWPRVIWELENLKKNQKIWVMNDHEQYCSKLWDHWSDGDVPRTAIWISASAARSSVHHSPVIVWWMSVAPPRYRRWDISLTATKQWRSIRVMGECKLGRL